MELTDKVVLVTGGGSGIGRSLCRSFAAKGARVLAADINESAAEQTVASLDATHPGDAILHDVTNPESWAATHQYVLSSYGRIDVLVNNAGVTRLGLVGEFPLDEYYLQNRINIDGVVLGCHAFAKDFEKHRSGHIVNVSSLAGLVALAGVSTYSASKFAVLGFTQALAQEMSEHGVQVSVLCPSVVDTPMNDDLEFPGDEDATMMSPDQVAGYVIDAVETDDDSVYLFTDPDYLHAVTGTLNGIVAEFEAFAARTARSS